jgi:hypothetical protein
VVPDEAIEADAYRYVLPSESRVIIVRRNAVVLAPAVGLLVANVTAFTLSAVSVIPGGAVALAGLGILFPASCYVLYRNIRAWWRAYIAVTSARIMLVNLPRKQSLMVIPLEEAHGMTFIRTLFGRIFGYGSFVIKESGTRRRPLKIRYLPYPEQMYIEVSGLLFPNDRDYR